MNPEQLLAHFDRVSEAPDAIPHLRRFILDLAVRGKLVEQDPNDEPASELLKRIQTEKARLISAGNIGRGRFVRSNGSDVSPYSIPNNWCWSQLAEVGILNPRNIEADELQTSFVPMSLISTEYGVPNKHEVRSWGEIKSGYTHFAEGDIALAKITPCFENGKSTIFRNLIGRLGAGTTELHIVRPIIVCADYVLIYLKCPNFIESGIPKMTGTAGQKRVPLEYFACTYFPLPPLTEQHRIVAKVDELMVLCDQLEAAREERERRRNRLAAASLSRIQKPAEAEDTFRDHVWFHLANLSKFTNRPDQIPVLRKTIRDLAVRGKLVLQDPNEEPASELLKRIVAEKARLMKAGEIRKPKPLPPIDPDSLPICIPESWEWVSIRTITSDREQKVPDKEFSYIDVSAIDNLRGRIVDASVLSPDVAPSRARKVVRKGDLIYSCVRPYLLNIAIIEKEYEPEPIVSTAFAVLNGFGIVSMRYLWIVLRSPFFIESVEGKMRGQAYPAINDSDFAPLPIPFPPLTEQHRIVAKVDELMALCDRLEVQLTSVQTESHRLLEALLHQALEPTLKEISA